jgi:2-keto-3-deoxy-L-rhamnonate aldolase RhmA
LESNGVDETMITDLRNGERKVGTMLRLVRDPAIARIAKNAGLDFVMTDMEHGAYSFETIADIFKVARAVGLGSFVRVAQLSKGHVSKALDCGAVGVMVPMVESVEQAQKLVAWSKFAPIGKRGLGGSGVHTDYASIGNRTPEFMAEANQGTICIAQIESAKAIDSIEKIAAVEGLDALLIGPNDLSISLGCPGDLMHGKVQEAIGEVADAAEKHGKIFGMHAGDALLEKWINRNMTLVMNLLDIGFLLSGMKGVAERYGKSNG